MLAVADAGATMYSRYAHFSACFSHDVIECDSCAWKDPAGQSLQVFDCASSCSPALHARAVVVVAVDVVVLVLVVVLEVTQPLRRASPKSGMSAYIGKF